MSCGDSCPSGVRPTSLLPSSSPTCRLKSAAARRGSPKDSDWRVFALRPSGTQSQYWAAGCSSLALARLRLWSSAPRLLVLDDTFLGFQERKRKARRVHTALEPNLVQKAGRWCEDSRGGPRALLRCARPVAQWHCAGRSSNRLLSRCVLFSLCDQKQVQNLLPFLMTPLDYFCTRGLCPISEQHAIRDPSMGRKVSLARNATSSSTVQEPFSGRLQGPGGGRTDTINFAGRNWPQIKISQSSRMTSAAHACARSP